MKSGFMNNSTARGVWSSPDAIEPVEIMGLDQGSILPIQAGRAERYGVRHASPADARISSTALDAVRDVGAPAHQRVRSSSAAP